MKSPMDTNTGFLFTPFWLDIRHDQLWHGSQALTLRPKTIAVLRYLVEHAGQVVTQDALLDTIWGLTAVSETVVRTSIRELRAILGDTTQHPQFIQTVHRRGYRFIAPVTVTDRPQAVLAPATEVLHRVPLSAPTAPNPIAYASTGLSLDEEYKLVTVLCCAVTDAPKLAVHRGPEAMHRLMQAFFAAAQEVMQRYDGTILYVTGEDFTAAFGAPVGQEDHARRAVLAALELAQRLRTQAFGEAHAPRMGLHTGPVVIGGLTYAPQQPYTAVGDTMHQASQLQRLAPPGAILMSAASHRLVQEEVRSEACGALAADGPGGSLPMYTVQDLTQRRAGVSGQGLRHRSRFVGRERELALLHERLAHAAQGHGQVVGIGGEPGMGKSRLLAEFHRSLAGQPVFYREGHCFPYSSITPYLPVCDLLRQGCGITEADGQEVITAKVRRYLEATQLLLEDGVPLLLQLLDMPVDDALLVPFSPQERKVRTFALLRHLVLHDCQQRPLVLVVENLHWADATSEEWLAALVEHLTGAAILLLVTYRPRYRPPWLGQSVATQLALPRLLPEDSRAVVQSVLQTTLLPEPLLQAIVTKAAGNPFFLEEITWVAMEPSTSSAVLGMPDTIQAVLAARIDRLPPDEKRLLQTAAVIGTDMAVPLLQAITEMPAEALTRALTHLQALELLYEKRRFPEPVYLFKHALTQDVAYHSLLAQRRQELHRLIGCAIETLYADRLAEHEEMLAYHFSKALEWTKALAYFLKAVQKAAQAFATREAITLYERAEEAASQLDEGTPIHTLMGILLAKAGLFLLVSDFERARTEGERLLRLARWVGDRGAEGAALVGMSLASFWGHQFDQALADAREAIQVAEAIGAQPVLAGGHLTTGLVYEMTGRLSEARDELEQAITISRSVGDVTNEATALVFAAELKGWEGLFTDAVGLYTEGIQLARAHNVLMPVLEGLFMCGIALTSKGDYDAALAMFEEGLALTEKIGDQNFAPRYLNSLGWLHMECGDLGGASGAEDGRARGDHESIANAELNLGDIFLTQGDLALAWEMLDGVHRLVQDPATSAWMKWRYSMHLFASRGEFWLARGEAVRAQEFANQCLDMATRTNAQKYLVRGGRLRGEIALARHQWDEAAVWLHQALTRAQTLGNPTQLWKTYMALGRLQTVAKRPEQARPAYHAARQVIEWVQARLQNPVLRVSLEHSLPIS
jgi:class 3 adenylate cyclase/tetratricopeptide (TPR) repeat protein